MRILPGSEVTWLRLSEKLLDEPGAVTPLQLELMRETLRLLISVVVGDAGPGTGTVVQPAPGLGAADKGKS